MYIKHNIPLQTQSSSSNCVQTSTSQFLGFYGLNVSPDNIEKSVSVRVNDEGRPMGTLFGDIGTWLRKTTDLAVVMHVFDAQIIDRSWHTLSQQDLLSEIHKMQSSGVSTARTPFAPLLIDAYASFMEAGGIINIVKCTNDLLRSLLQNGPILAIVSFNYMYDYPRSRYDFASKQYKANFADGKVMEHAIVITGYADGKYFYNDPDSEMGGQLSTTNDILIGAICTAQINSDNYLLTVVEK